MRMRTLPEMIDEAYREAATLRTAEWSEALENAGFVERAENITGRRPSDKETHAQADAALASVQHLTTGQSTDEITEEVLRALDNVDSVIPPGRETVSATTTDGAVTISLADSGLFSCQVDADQTDRWTALMLNTALANTLGKARQALREQAQRDATDADVGSPQRLDQLLGDLFSRLAEPRRSDSE